MTQLEMIASTRPPSSGKFSISPRWNSTFLTPTFSALLLARLIMSTVMSTPITLPSGPTWWAARKQSMPPPLPRSRTVSPGLSSAMATGLPHPAEAATASIGTSFNSDAE